MTEIELRGCLVSTQAGDQTSSKRLFKQLGPRLLSYFRRNVADAAAIPDLLQQVNIAVWRIDLSKVHTSLWGYIMRIACHVLSCYYRKLQGLPELAHDEDDVGDAPSSAPDPEFLLSLSDDLRLIMRAIRRLPMKYQALLELSYWQRVPGRELAGLFKVTEAGIRGRMRLALEQLELKLTELASSAEGLKKSTMTLADWRARVRAWLDEQASPGVSGRASTT